LHAQDAIGHDALPRSEDRSCHMNSREECVGGAGYVIASVALRCRSRSPMM